MLKVTPPDGIEVNVAGLKRALPVLQRCGIASYCDALIRGETRLQAYRQVYDQGASSFLPSSWSVTLMHTHSRDTWTTKGFSLLVMGRRPAALLVCSASAIWYKNVKS